MMKDIQKHIIALLLVLCSSLSYAQGVVGICNNKCTSVTNTDCGAGIWQVKWWQGDQNDGARVQISVDGTTLYVLGYTGIYLLKITDTSGSNKGTLSFNKL
jgi:hypothetical protein